ncbi:hypothetical protein AUJ95_04580 [Candidatus Desantisbacteria bacterium CG2_30_40_21]|uniref:DUF177 domain-containing protein n=5 Tax=unclassified Candidatus Desantisiibacteriota TaxID=3106372 RepID=A0A2M7J834_9BACT|nr:MAG: hypothetical protein AUJ95_04580 [Candidatus Desantisbacteria bacterium CG2_30_40_21]PIP39929.1 MAG: hypothetical protein COX18_08430 [Candidatus Desantisbacteria bacterium CG23_combo_of_CG06-09_8_20_14_all_40_23]PIX15487.1 MAG: hypothetical protein COZ71_10175 [Candidatus Desantisbacteria bacterium CG_4_8_14_3_um_filter_40_12]PIY19592.1 MAG: hypothetical protein COZ13_04555 [Candidatus Desantisbacteria bacterium CG_4_10_14_3_um_filter_40_18]PJB29109.1 MAG: hypothetical protein CO110_07
MLSLANIDISEIAEKEIAISGQIDPEEKQVALLLRDVNLLIQKPIDFHVELEGMGHGRIELSGWLRAEIQLECCHCLSLFDYPVEKDFIVDYLPAIKGNDEPGSLEITTDDIYVNNYTGNTLNILEEYCAQLVLAVPMMPRCHEECKGLCSQCGQNLNIKKCSCVSPQILEGEGKFSAISYRLSADS